MKKVVSICMAVCLLLFSVPKADAADDITGHFFEKEMRFLIAEGILQGYEPGIYKPDGSITRAEFAAMVIRALELDSVETAGFSIAESSEPLLYSDVNPTDWYYTVINSAAEQGVVKGYPDGTFKPNAQISRQEMAVMIFRAIDSKGVISSPADLTFTDKDQIGASFMEAVQRLVNLGIMGGNPDNTFAPLAQATRGQTAAVISRMLIKLNPTLEKSYSVVEFNSDGSSRLINSYADFNTAKNNVTNNQAILKGNSIIYIKNGIAVTNSFTIIYNDTTFAGSGRTYVSSGTELQYLDAGENWVRISISGKEGYVDPNKVNLTPAPLIVDQSSYKRVGNELYHTIYNPLTKVSNNVLLGVAPSFMQEGQKYYSWDGGVFYNSAGQAVGTAYQYFNYLSARTVSNYSSEELNSYIDTKLAEIEQLYKSNPSTYVRYKDATTISKLKGLGTYIKEAESKYRINALLILSMAMHESDYGMSNYAQERNNLFGLNAVDSDEDQADWFATPNEAIDGLATYYLNLNYIPPKASFANGAVTGNKAFGFNVKYASDPYWGQKVASHMYRADKFLGKKDINKYRIGVTNTPDLNVRHEPTVSEATLQFTYPNAGMPVAILESSSQANGSIWYKVVSDNIAYTEGYIRSDFVNDVGIAK